MDGMEKVDVDAGGGRVRSCDRADELGRELVRLHPDLRAHALLLTQGSASADDLVQDVVERALVARDRFRSGSNLKAWLNAIMKNLFIDAYRQRTSRLSRDLGCETAAGGAARSPLDLVTMDDVLEALALLGPADREIFTLAHLEGLSYRDIATRLGIPRNTAGTRLMRVRSKLRRLLTRVYEIRERTTRCA
jgi:RNA polymerase sigma-70 factor (ECF subfamily)